MTTEQLKYYRGYIVRTVAQALKLDEDYVHQYLKGKFISIKYLPDDCMQKYIMDVSVWAAEHGVILDEPKK